MRKLFSISSTASGRAQRQPSALGPASHLGSTIARLELSELLEVAALVAQRIAELREVSEKDALRAVDVLLALSGVSVADAVRHLDPDGSIRPDAPPGVEYVDPDSGRVWRGRGRKPNWIKDFEASGRDLSEIARAPVSVGDAETQR